MTDDRTTPDPLAEAERIYEQSRQARKREFLQLAVSLVDGKGPEPAEIAEKLERLGRTAPELRETCDRIRKRDALLPRKKEAEAAARRLEKAEKAIAQLEQERDSWVEKFDEEKLRPALIEAERHRQAARQGPASMSRDLVELCCDPALQLRRAELQKYKRDVETGRSGHHFNSQKELQAELQRVFAELGDVERLMAAFDPRNPAPAPGSTPGSAPGTDDGGMS